MADLLTPAPKRARRVAAKAAGTKAAPGRGLADQLVKLGIARDQDLVLHLPLRYEDHTRVAALRKRFERLKEKLGRLAREQGLIE